MSTRTAGYCRGQARGRHLALIQGLPADPGCGPACASPGAAGTPAGVLRALLEELSTCGVPLAGVTLTRLQVTLVFANGRVAWCCGAWLAWPTGRAGSRGRPLYTLHSIHDAARAAARLTQLARSAAECQAAREVEGWHG